MNFVSAPFHSLSDARELAEPDYSRNTGSQDLLHPRRPHQFRKDLLLDRAAIY
jgi:hypothetical protein